MVLTHAWSICYLIKDWQGAYASYIICGGGRWMELLKTKRIQVLFKARLRGLPSEYQIQIFLRFFHLMSEQQTLASWRFNVHDLDWLVDSKHQYLTHAQLGYAFMGKYPYFQLYLEINIRSHPLTSAFPQRMDMIRTSMKVGGGNQLSVINEDPCGEHPMVVVHVWSQLALPQGIKLVGRQGWFRHSTYLPIKEFDTLLYNVPWLTRVGETVHRHITFDGIMATKPGVLTDWPWTPLGSFKVHSVFLSLKKNALMIESRY